MPMLVDFVAAAAAAVVLDDSLGIMIRQVVVVAGVHTAAGVALAAAAV